jgi:hypothetical protein
LAAWSTTAFAEIDAAAARGAQYLRGRAGSGQVGETALIGLALLKTDVPASDPSVTACVNKVLQRFSGGYVPERQGGHDVYEAGCVAMLLANLEGESKRAVLEVVAQYLTSKQKAGGCWDYDNRTAGDTSISQYAVLGLWEAENGGATISPAVWDHAASWFLSVQRPDGSWTYHPDQASYQSTVSMTAAGVGSLLICQRQLNRIRKGTDAPSKLLVTLSPEGPSAPYEVQTSTARLDQAIRAGMTWLGANFSTANTAVMGPSVYYGLYGIERVGALADKTTLGRTDWYEQGRRFIHSTQGANGTWNAAHGADMNTVWAVLFLSKSTAKSLRRIEIKRLGAGTLLGGRGLPKDLSSMTVAGGRVVARPMNGAVEGMLAVLEDPRAQAADSALAGLVTRYEAEGPRVLRPHKDRFRKLLRDRDPGLRRVGTWALGRTGDLDVAPALIDALADPDEDVVTSAKLGLQILSRKIVGLGPPANATPDQRREAVARWRSWYSAIRPLDLEGQDDDDAPGSPVANRTGSAQ